MIKINFTSDVFDQDLDRKTRNWMFFWNAAAVGLVFGMPTLAIAVVVNDITKILYSCSLAAMVFVAAAVLWSLLRIKKLFP